MRGNSPSSLQNPDKRIVFAIPYERDFTLIGTTDIAFNGDPASVEISDAETAYLCESVSRYFRNPGHAGGCGAQLFRRAAAL